MSLILLVVAIVLFVVAAFMGGIHLDESSDLALFALACFAAAHLPLGDWVKR